MVDLGKNLVGSSIGNMLPIEAWSVMFMTPFGLLATLGEAVDVVNKAQADFDPSLTIIPVVVAISESGYQEVVSR